MSQSQSDYFGRMNDPTVAAQVTGPCGDTMEFYLVIEEDRLTAVRYFTDGCTQTRRCGDTVAQWVCGRSVRAALDLSAGQVLEALPDLPAEHGHCAVLAVSTLYRAIGAYWVMLGRT